MKIGILTAMTSEYEQLAALLEQQHTSAGGPFTYLEGTLGGHGIILTQCGIGKVNAAAGAVELVRTFRPDCVISTGVAGGIDASLRVMDVVVSSELVYHDVWCGPGNAYGQIQGCPERFRGDGRLCRAALLLTEETRIREGLICTGDRFVTRREELDTIKSRFADGLAVDMESAAIAQVCHRYGMPFVSFRIISDTPGVEAHQEQYENFWGEMADRSFGVTRRFLQALPDRL